MFNSMGLFTVMTIPLAIHCAPGATSDSCIAGNDDPSNQRPSLLQLTAASVGLNVPDLLEAEVERKSFCCFSGNDANDVCGTCWPDAKAKAGDYCDDDGKCQECGGEWCSGGEAEPTPSPPTDGFCCFSGANAGDVCGTCYPSAKAKTGDFCDSDGKCQQCGGEWCSGNGGGAEPTPSPTSPPTLTPAPSPTSAPAPTAPGTWDPRALKLTHYWDCSGQGCDAGTLQPWDKSKYISPPGYGPQDPNHHGGPLYGEKMWLTGAASDALSLLLGDDDGCCGVDHNDDGVGGCGKCLLIQQPDSLHPDWTAVVMKKNRCPPWSSGCGADTPHFDVAAPGFDNLAYSTANVCGIQAGTGFANQNQSAAVGSWWEHGCSNTEECAHLCEELPHEFRAGCKLFASWGWLRGNPGNAKFRAVECPSAFTNYVASLFDENGATQHVDENGHMAE